LPEKEKEVFLGQVEAERQRVRGHRFKADGARNGALNHGRHIFLREIEKLRLTSWWTV